MPETNKHISLQASAGTRERTLLVALAALGLTALSLSGCGSGNRQVSLPAANPAMEVGETAANPAGAGRAVITIAWPARPKNTTGRLIPVATNSIKVVLSYGSTVVGTQLAVRSADGTSGTVTFDALPIGTLSVVATAYVSTDGTGTALASGTGSVTIVSGTTTNFGFSMNSTIDHLTIAPAAANLLAGKTLTLTATAYDASGAVVLLTPGKLAWSAQPANGATSVDSNGVVTAGSAAGTAKITVTDSESKKSAMATVNVTTGPDSVGPAQFNPNGTDYVGTATVSDGTGGWIATGDAYAFDTTANPPTLTDTTTKTLVATGKFVTQTFGQARNSVTYAVFDFPKDVSLTGSATVTGTGANPLVVLTQGSFTLGGSASLSVASSRFTTGAGGGAGPGNGSYTSYYNVIYYDGGGGFGGAGSGGTVNGTTGFGAVISTVIGGVTYGTDFADATNPHLQGGSNGSVLSGGGAIYIGAVGSLKLSGSASLLAGGSTGDVFGTLGGGGSGGGIALFGGNITITDSPKVDASGGAGTGKAATPGNVGVAPGRAEIHGWGGGGGRVVIGYGAGTAAPDISFVTVNGGGFTPNYGGPGSPGVKSVVSFAGF